MYWKNNVEAFRYTVLIHISRMTSATSARASRIKSPGIWKILIYEYLNIYK